MAAQSQPTRLPPVYNTISEIADKFLGETAFKTKALYWPEFCLDTTNYANDVRFELNYIDRLVGVGSRDELRNIRKTVKKPLEQSNAVDILKHFYHNKSGLFYQTKSAPFKMVLPFP